MFFCSYAIAHAHPDYEITCLVRNSDKGAQVAKDYPSIRFAYGELNDVKLIEDKSSKADIVLSQSIANLREVQGFADLSQTARTPTTKVQQQRSSEVSVHMKATVPDSSSTALARASYLSTT